MEGAGRGSMLRKLSPCGDLRGASVGTSCCPLMTRSTPGGSIPAPCALRRKAAVAVAVVVAVAVAVVVMAAALTLRMKRGIIVSYTGELAVPFRRGVGGACTPAWRKACYQGPGIGTTFRHLSTKDGCCCYFYVCCCCCLISFYCSCSCMCYCCWPFAASTSHHTNMSMYIPRLPATRALSHAHTCTHARTCTHMHARTHALSHARLVLRVRFSCSQVRRQRVRHQ